MTSTTTKTSTNSTAASKASKASKAKLQTDINAATLALAEAHAEVTKADGEFTAAKNEAARIDGSITSGELTYGGPDSMKAHETARFAGLSLQGRQALEAKADVTLRDAYLAQLIYDIENDDRIIKGDIRADGLALAEEIAALAKAFLDRHEAHNVARLEIIERAGITSAFDAVNRLGTEGGRMTFGKQNLNITERRNEPEFVELDGNPIHSVTAHAAVEDLLQSAASLVRFTPEELSGSVALVPFYPEAPPVRPVYGDVLKG